LVVLFSEICPNPTVGSAITSKSTLELYNYFQDPGEMANVALQYPTKVKELQKLMDSQRTTNPYWNFKK